MPEPEASRLVQGYRRAVELGAPLTFEEAPGDLAGNRVFRTTLVPIRDGHGRVHRQRLFGVSDDRPVAIIAVDKAERIRAVVPEIRQLVQEGLITVTAVEVIS